MAWISIIPVSETVVSQQISAIIQTDKFGTSEDSEPTYFPGEVVTGDLIINLTKIELKLVGKGKVRWSESNGETYSSSERYLDDKMVAFEGQSLESGEYTFPFRFYLPRDIPSSLDFEYGNVEYKITCTIIKVWKQDNMPIYIVKRPVELKNCIVKHSIIVNGILDLNLLPWCRNANWKMKERDIGFSCWTSGLISAILQTNRQGYVPGESICYNVKICNLSTKWINMPKLKLLRYTTYFAGKKRKVDKYEIIHQIKDELKYGVPPRKSDLWQDNMTIPTNIETLTNLVGHKHGEGYGIIQINYCLQLKLHPAGGITPSMKLVVPIIIGTVPLRAVVE